VTAGSSGSVVTSPVEILGVHPADPFSDELAIGPTEGLRRAQ